VRTNAATITTATIESKEISNQDGSAAALSAGSTEGVGDGATKVPNMISLPSAPPAANTQERDATSMPHNHADGKVGLGLAPPPNSYTKSG
jgi:hypothetical protein